MNSLRQLLSRETESFQLTTKIQLKSSKMLQNPIWRKLIVQWYYRVVDSNEFDRDVVYNAVSILDRFLALPKSAKKASDKKHYEMAAIASLFLALRLFSDDPWPCVEELLEQIKSCISTLDIRQTCGEIYQSIDWENVPPTPSQFAKAMIELLPGDVDEPFKNDLLQNALYELELSVEDELCMCLHPSLLAWMALENAFEIAECCSDDDRRHFRNAVIEMTGHVHSSTLRRRLQRLHTQAEHSQRLKKMSLVSSSDVNAIAEAIDLITVGKNKRESCSADSALRRTKRAKYLHALCA